MAPTIGNILKNSLLIACTAILICCGYAGIFHSHRYYKYDFPLFLVLMGIACLILIHQICLNHPRKNSKFVVFIFITCMGAPIAGAVIFLHNIYIEQQLADYGADTYGIVTKIYRKKSKSHVAYYADFEYKVNGKKWIQQMNNKERKLATGDTLILRCSTQDPEVFEQKD